MKNAPNIEIIQNKWLVIILLMLAYTFSFMDRYIVNLLVDPMKEDLHLTDTQVSLLLGISFALFYAILGIPLGRLADKKSRTGIIAAGITVWSIMTALCGTAKTYMQMFLFRMGVGVGEATLSPSAYSLITDYFPKRLWATAISIYSLGIYLGSGIAYIAGGKLIQVLTNYHEISLPLAGTIFGWQLVFLLFGLPGLIIALLLMLVKEPLRIKGNENSKNSLKEFFRWIQMEGKLFMLLCIGSSIFNIAVYATATWLPTYLKRVHHLTIDEAGLLLGLSTLILPSIGIIAGGKIADHFAVKEGLHGRLKILFYAVLLFIPANLFYPFTPTVFSTALAMIPHGLLISATVGMGIACIQEIVPSEYRGTASALLLFSQNLIGMGLGPVCIGLMNDYVYCDSIGIGKSLMTVSITCLIITVIIFKRAMSLNKNIKLQRI